MCKVQMLRALVNQRLTVAVEEIFVELERTIAEYEEEIYLTKEENERQRQLLDAVFKKPQVVLHRADVQQLIGQQEARSPQPQRGSSTLKQQDPLIPHIKEEKEELWTPQEGEHCLRQEKDDLTSLPLTGVCVKTEDKPPESSQLHHSPSEEKRGAEPVRSGSSQHMTTEAVGNHCGGSQAENLLAPLSDSDDTASHSSEDEDSDDTQEALSSDTDFEGDMRTRTGDKHTEYSKKKTGKECFPCSYCAKSFSKKCGLTQHMQAHTEEKHFSCSVCGKRFSRKCNLIQHKITHTGEKPFICSVCGKRFSMKSNMVTHMRIHTGEKTYSCSLCAKTFTQHNSLTVHMRGHTGEKPFSCSICGRTFSMKSNMLTHMRTHTGEKPYS